MPDRPGRRLLTVVESLGRGGAERLVVTTHEHLDRARFVPRVAALWPPYDLAPELEALGVRVERLDTGGRRDLLGAVLALRALMRTAPPELVHTHLFVANVAARLAAPRGVRLLTSLHNPDYSYEDNGTLRFRAWKALDGWTGRRNRLFLAVSEAVKADYERHTALGPIRVLPNYLDVEALRAERRGVDRAVARERLGLREGETAVLHVGRFHRQKGQDLLLRAFAHAHREEPRLRLLLVGDGPDLPAARALARDLGLEGPVVFAGSVERPLPWFAAADVFAFPSRWEAFGIALLEAAALGLPAVAARTGGIVEILGEDGGVLVPPESVEALAVALLALTRDPALRARLGEAAARRAEGFDARPAVRHLEAIYDEVMSEGVHARG